MREQAIELLEVFGLTKHADDYAGTLSGGQRKLLELARALMAGPRIVLLDEPMAGVNPTLGRRLLEHMQRLRARGRHDLPVRRARHGGGHGPLRPRRRDGRGPRHRRRRPHEVCADQGVIDAYLGGAEGSRTTPDERRRAEPGRSARVLATEDLVGGYVPEVDILRGCSITVREGEIVTIIGPNGAGKSTLVKAVFGLLEAARGRDAPPRRRHRRPQPHEMTRRGLSYVPQVANVFPASPSRRTWRWASLDRRPTRADGPHVRAVPAPRRAHAQRAGTISGGERQMVAMARALMPDPQVLLLDEPSAGLAPASWTRSSRRSRTSTGPA